MAKYDKKNGYILRITDIYDLYDYLCDNEKSIRNSFIEKHGDHAPSFLKVPNKPKDTSEKQRTFKVLCKFYDALIKNLCDSTDIGSIWKSKAEFLKSILPPELGIPNTDYFLIFKPECSPEKTEPSSIIAAANPISCGSNIDVILTVTVTGKTIPTGKVQFYIDGEKYGPERILDVSGVASVICMPSVSGNLSYKAEYLGDDNFYSKTSVENDYSIEKYTFVKGFHYTVTREIVVYDEQPHTICVTLQNNEQGTKIEYSLDGVNYSDASPPFTEVGIHTVYYKISNDDWNEVVDTEVVIIGEKTPKTKITGKSDDEKAQIERLKDMSFLLLSYIDSGTLNTLKNHIYKIIYWYKTLEKSVKKLPEKDVFDEAECVFFAAAPFVHKQYHNIVKSTYDLKNISFGEAVAQLEQLLYLLNICCEIAKEGIRKIREKAFADDAFDLSKETPLEKSNKKAKLALYSEKMDELETTLISTETIDNLMHIHRLYLVVNMRKDMPSIEFDKSLKKILDISNSMNDEQRYFLLHSDKFTNNYNWIIDRVERAKKGDNMAVVDQYEANRIADDILNSCLPVITNEKYGKAGDEFINALRKCFYDYAFRGSTRQLIFSQDTPLLPPLHPQAEPEATEN